MTSSNGHWRRAAACRLFAGTAGVASLLSMFAGTEAGAQEPARPVRAIEALDLERYAGLWYEVARIPNRFQQRCAAEVTATYDLLDDGTIRVVNACLSAKGDTIRAEGRARLAERDGPASRLKVRFAPGFLSFLSAVWADYWVLEVTEGYTAALVGTPDRRYLWVLSRTPELDQSTWDRLLNTAATQGFDLSRVVRAGEP